MPATAAQILAKLKKAAPNIAISTAWHEDPHFRWDGDGPDPAEEGYLAYDVDVYARAIADGKLVEGTGSIGGSYSKPGEFDPEVNGYFLDLLRQALDDLWEQLPGAALDDQVHAAKEVIMHASQIRYEEERNPRRKQDWSPRRKKPRRL